MVGIVADRVVIDTSVDGAPARRLRIVISVRPVSRPAFTHGGVMRRNPLLTVWTICHRAPLRRISRVEHALLE